MKMMTYLQATCNTHLLRCTACQTSVAMSAQQSMALSYGKIHIDARAAFPKLTWTAGVNISCCLGDIHPCTGPSHWVNWAEILPPQSTSFSPF